VAERREDGVGAGERARGHRVAAPEGLLDHVAADAARRAEDQEAHHWSAGGASQRVRSSVTPHFAIEARMSKPISA